MADKPSNSHRIKHMLEAIAAIFTYTKDITKEEFLSNQLIQDAVIRNFEVLGEAAYHVTKEFKKKHDEIEWKKIQGLRHVLAHDYYKVSPYILWNTKEEFLSKLQEKLQKLTQEEFPED